MPLSRLENFLKNIQGNVIYVDPNELDATDSIENQGNSQTRPFKTIQRALIEAARFSYVVGQRNDKFDLTTIILAAGTIVKLKVGKVEFMKAMGALGAGLAGFFLGIMAADGFATIGAGLGLDGSKLKTLMSNFFGAFDGIGVAVLGGVIAIAATVAKLKIDKMALIGGMTAIGAGLAGFFLGIIAADGFATIGAGLGLNGESLKTLMGNFFGAFTQAGLTGVAVLGAILAAGAATAAAGISPLKIVGGMTAVGAGLAGFFLGIIAADGFAKIADGLGVNGESLKTLMSNFFGAFTQAGVTGIGVLMTIIAAGAGAA